MKLNQTTRIIGNKVILVPYRKHHVPKYHDWMSIPEIQELTASEPLSLEEEYEMQTKWQLDSDKLTFIILRKDLYENSNQQEQNEREILSMIGDVNCFITPDYDHEDRYFGELEIMIVDKENRRNGYGAESIDLMINYCAQYFTNPRINEFIVKIGDQNRPSICMFEKFGFRHHEYISAFKQTCLILDLNTNENRNKFSKKLNIDLNYN